jgi:hypothetical protein
LLLPAPAVAHLPSIGLGPVYDGIFHLLLSPEDLIPVIALALLAGQRGASSSRRVLWILPAAWLAGSLAEMFVGFARGTAFTCVSFLLLGGLIAGNAKIPVPLLTTLAAVIGFSMDAWMDLASIALTTALTLYWDWPSPSSSSLQSSRLWSYPFAANGL